MITDFLGESPPMQFIFDRIKKIAPSKSNILIHGETGTGKERVAGAIHELSTRKSAPFVAVNCAAIPENLLESELFGHAKGSFTGALQSRKGLFESANGGSIFLDEIGDLNLSLQTKLLRVIQERSVRLVGDNADRKIDVRIIAATHRDLKKAVREKHFREDLYFRLSVIPISIPPLRERGSDIELLAKYFLKKFAAVNGANILGFTEDANQKLASHSWPGNVRELENVIERAVVLDQDSWISCTDLSLDSENEVPAMPEFPAGQLPPLEKIEQQYIEYVLKSMGGKKQVACQVLGINRRTLYRKERAYSKLADDKIAN